MRDQLDRILNISETPKRIISLVPSQTELLVDLGLEDSIVGITKFCVHPKHLKTSKTIVGGTKSVHLDRIKALKPDVILCNKEENTQAMIWELEQIAPVHISDIETLADNIELIEMYGVLFDKMDVSSRLVTAIQQKHSEFIEFIKEKPTQSVVYFIWKDPWMIAAKQTFIETLLSLNHFEIFHSELDRYPEIKLKINPHVNTVFLSTEPYPFKAEHKSEVQGYFPNAKIQIVDGEMFSWYGSRLVKAFDYFKTLHGQI